MKKHVLTFSLLGLPLAAGIAAAGLSRAVYGRSLIATIAEQKIRRGGTKRLLSDPAACQAHIEKLTAESGKTYCLPSSVQFHVEVRESSEAGMQVFFLNENAPSDTLIFYLPGGAYINDPIPEHWRLCDTLAADLNNPVIVPIYPKLPSHTWQDAYEAMKSLYRKYTDHPQRRKVILMGDSAGGGLALSLSQYWRDTEQDIRQPDELILLSPWVDVSMDNEELRQYEPKDPLLGIYGLRVAGTRWADTLDIHDPRVSPIYGDFQGLGKISLFTGTRELFYPDIIKLSEKLREAGIQHRLHIGKGLNHVYPVFPIPEGRAAVNEIKAIITEGAI